MRNNGLISAATGDITLAGRQVRQDGVLVASTDIGARGAIHLLNRASDASGSVALGEAALPPWCWSLLRSPAWTASGTRR